MVAVLGSRAGPPMPPGRPGRGRSGRADPAGGTPAGSSRYVPGSRLASRRGVRALPEGIVVASACSSCAARIDDDVEVAGIKAYVHPMHPVWVRQGYRSRMGSRVRTVVVDEFVHELVLVIDVRIDAPVVGQSILDRDVRQPE